MTREFWKSLCISKSANFKTRSRKRILPLIFSTHDHFYYAPPSWRLTMFKDISYLSLNTLYWWYYAIKNMLHLSCVGIVLQFTFTWIISGARWRYVSSYALGIFACIEYRHKWERFYTGVSEDVKSEPSGVGEWPDS